MSEKNVIDVARAQMWVRDVQREISEVELVLGQLREKCSENAMEGDPLYGLLNKTGNMLDDIWTAASKSYRQAWEDLEESINAFEKLGDKLEDVFGNVLDHLKR